MYKKTKPRSVMELLERNLSEREVADLLGCSRNTVSEVRELCKKYGKSWNEIRDMTNDQLYDILYPDKFKRTTNYRPVDYSYVHAELKKTGVTMKLLWQEYRDKCESEGEKHCAYPTFNVNYYKYTADKNYTSHIEHKPGVEIEVDWSGPTMSYTDADSGEIHTAYLFVATLPYSRYGFPLKKNKSADEMMNLAREIGPSAFELVRRMYDESKVREQATQTVTAILAIADTFTPEILEAACKKSMKQYHMPYYKTVYSNAKKLNNDKELKEFKESNKRTGIVRGADYYK